MPIGHLTKVWIQLPADEWTPAASEVLWAEPVGPNEYCLCNIPVLAYGYAYGDVVIAEAADGGNLIVRGIARRGGHSTYRVIVGDEGSVEVFDDYCRRLHAMGCGVEDAMRGASAIDVPPRADVYDVRQLLKEGESKGVWEFEEAFMGYRPS